MSRLRGVQRQRQFSLSIVKVELLSLAAHTRCAKRQWKWSEPWKQPQRPFIIRIRNAETIIWEIHRFHRLLRSFFHCGNMGAKQNRRSIKDQLSPETISNKESAACGSSRDGHKIKQHRALRHAAGSALPPKPSLNPSKAIRLCFRYNCEDLPVRLNLHCLRIVEQCLSRDRPADHLPRFHRE